MRTRRLPALLVAMLVAGPFTPTGATAEPAPAHGSWPLRPRPAVVAGFDPPATRWGSGHRGVDLLGRPGQLVRASLAGRVAFAGTLAGRGVVVVDHGATRTTYQPVAAAVHVGDEVGAGTALGRLQLPGSHCFPRACLHWGLIEGRSHYLDPLVLVGAAPVRLLPLGSAMQVGPTVPWTAPSSPFPAPAFSWPPLAPATPTRAQ